MEKIKILHFELSENVGGIETFLLNLYQQMDREMFQFDFVTQLENPAFKEQYEELGGKICKVSSYKKIWKYKKDIEKLFETGYDIVHIHKNSAANIIPIILCKQNRIPAVFIHSHNTAPSKGKIAVLLHKLNRKYLVKNTLYRFACSTEAGKWMFGNSSFEIMTNGIMTKEFKFDEQVRIAKRKELGILDNELIIGHIGRFSPQKNHLFLIDIFNEIKTEMQNAKLLLVGGGQLESEAKEKVKKLELEDSVCFLGVREDISALLMSMDVFIMPSLYEGLPIVAIEAQATGVPMYLADTISSESEISDVVRWFSIKKSDKEIAKLVTKVEILSSVDRESKNEQVLNKGYDIKKTADRIEKYYKMAVKKNSKRK